MPRTDHSRAADRVTGLLHQLARLPDTDVPSIANFTEENTTTTAGPERDVRQEILARHHELIFATYGTLADHENFVLINDHDLKPLYYQFAGESTGQFTGTTSSKAPRCGRSASDASRVDERQDRRCAAPRPHSHLTDVDCRVGVSPPVSAPAATTVTGGVT